MSSWIHETTGAKAAYYAGWTYWACHVTYIAAKGSGGLKALSWMIFQNAEKYASFHTRAVQLATFGVLLFFCWVASRGLNPLKKFATIAGTSMFVMSILYILLMFAAPVINPGGGFLSVDFSLKNLIPVFDWKYFGSLSILVFAVGGCEKISPYVNQVEDPAKGFPRSMIFAAGMVIVCAVFGTIAMGMMFDPAVIADNFDSYNANGAYWAFERLGEYYGVGNLLMIIYAACNAIGQFSTLVVSIDAPLRMLLDNEDARQFIPTKLLKKNKYGAYVNGIWMVVILSGSIIHLFTNDPQVIDLGRITLRIAAATEIFFSFTVMAGGICRGSGDVNFSLMVSLIGMWGFRIGMVWIATHVLGLGVTGVWAAIGIDCFIRACLFAARLISGKWIHE